MEKARALDALRIVPVTKPDEPQRMHIDYRTMNYFREFIFDYASIVAPLNNLLKGETKRSIKKIIWPKEALKGV